MVRRIAAVLLVLAGLIPGPAPGQGERLTRIIVAFPAGGAVDFVARAIADSLGKELGTRVIVENKPGGNGAIAAETVVPVASTPQELTTLLRHDTEKWGKLIRAKKITAD